MTGLVRKATFFTVGAMLVAASAMAGVPSPGYSSITTPNQITDDSAPGVGDGGGFYVVGTDNGSPALPDPIGKVHVNVRDLANNPINNCSVSVSLAGCEEFFGTQLNADGSVDAGATTFCPGTGPSVRKYTDVSGNVDFILEGGGANIGPNNDGGDDIPSCGLGGPAAHAAGKVVAAGVTLRNVIITTLDMDRANGCDANDLSLLISDQGAIDPSYMRSDYDFDFSTGANDLSLMIDFIGATGATTLLSASGMCN